MRIFRVRIIVMKIVWDDAKRAANIAKHRLDFATLTEEFFADALVLSAKGGRYQAIGRDASGIISVVFGILGREAFSVVSMRPASKKERKLYEEAQKS